VFKSIRNWSWVAAAAVVATGAVFIAQAAIPDGDGVIHACYQKTTGDLRVVDDQNSCKNTETPLAWGQTGPEGPQGDEGPQGPEGPSGLSHAYHVVANTQISRDFEDEIATLTPLPAGSYVVWANVNVVGDDSGLGMVCVLRVNGDASHPIIPVGYTPMYSGRDDQFGFAAMATVVTVPTDGGSIGVHCGVDEGTAEAQAEMVAIAVDAVN
jgi:hypothetical protein